MLFLSLVRDEISVSPVVVIGSVHRLNAGITLLTVYIPDSRVQLFLLLMAQKCTLM